MKVVADTMVWVSYSAFKDGFRHQLIEAARRKRVRFFVSEYILQELAKTLVDEFDLTPRFARLAQNAIKRSSKCVDLPLPSRRWVYRDPNDDPIVQTALLSKADYLVTGDRQILNLGQIEDVRIINERVFAEVIGFSTEVDR